MVIGLTGPNASGKGEAALYIKSKGFVYHSLSDILREEAKGQGIEALRENLIRLGNELRRKSGPSALALRVIETLSETEDHVVDSIRNPSEVEALRKVKGFVLLGIDAPVEVRFKRGVERKRPGDAETLDDFIKKEEKENKDNIEGQQLKKCLQMADVTITNDSTIKEFRKRIDDAIRKNKKA